MKPPVYMIVMSDCEISQYYKNRVLSSWKDYEVNFFEAVTPKTMHQYSYLDFGIKHRFHAKRDVPFTETEQAVWYSHVECWVIARTKPIIIIEHDIELVKDIDDSLFENDMVCLAHSNKKNTQKLAGGAYYLTPKVARVMVQRVKVMQKISCNSDAVIHDTCDKVGVWKHEHCFQVKDDKIGVTVEHNK